MKKILLYALVVVSIFCSGLFAGVAPKKAISKKPIASANTALLESVENNDLKKVKEAIEQGADVNAKGAQGLTPLHIASAMRSEEMIKLLLDKGAYVKAKTDNQWTPLHFAADGGEGEKFVRIIKLLLDKGADVNAQTDIGATPLIGAVHFPNNLEIVKLLIKRGADVNKQETAAFGHAPIHVAAIFSSEDMVKLLLDNGANVNVQISGKFDKGNTALHRAALTGDESLAKLLLSKGANPFIKNAKSETPFDIAKQGSTIIIHGEPEAETAKREKEFKDVANLLEQHMKTFKK
jgi:ankyrin repeat protein